MKQSMIIFTKSRLKQIIYGSIAFCVFSGCISSKSITYFQPLSPKMDKMVTNMQPVYMPVIKSGDVLSITVHGLDKDDREIFSPLSAPVSQYLQITSFVVLPTITGFTVDPEGNIVLPQVGKIKVAGFTTKEIEIHLTEQLQQFIKSPMVSVHVANYIITILGEVARPAQYVIPHNQITIPEALALAGDLTIYGKRNNVLIFRELNGQRHVGRVDLTKRDMFDSPYYYLYSGDMIYVEPTSGRLTSSDRIFQVSPLIISSLTFLLLIISTIIKQ